MGPIQPTYYPPYAPSPNHPAYGYHSNPYQQIPSTIMPNYQQLSYPQYNQTYPPSYATGYGGNPYHNYNSNALSGVSIIMKADPV